MQSRGGAAAQALTSPAAGGAGAGAEQQRRARAPQPPGSSLRWLGAVRGGVTQAKSKSKVTPKAAAAAGATNKIRFATEKSFGQKAKEWYRGTPTITRLHLTLALVLTGLGTLVIDPSYFLLDPVATVAGLQLWRPFTAAAFLGPPSMSWASNIYFLHQYGAWSGVSRGGGVEFGRRGPMMRAAAAGAASTQLQKNNTTDLLTTPPQNPHHQT